MADDSCSGRHGEAPDLQERRPSRSPTGPRARRSSVESAIEWPWSPVASTMARRSVLAPAYGPDGAHCRKSRPDRPRRAHALRPEPPSTVALRPVARGPWPVHRCPVPRGPWSVVRGRTLSVCHRPLRLTAPGLPSRAGRCHDPAMAHNRSPVYQARYGWDLKTAGVVALSAVFTAVLLLPGMPLFAQILGLPLFGGGGLFMSYVALSRRVAFRVDETGVLLGGALPGTGPRPAMCPGTTSQVSWSGASPRAALPCPMSGSPGGRALRPSREMAQRPVLPSSTSFRCRRTSRWPHGR